MRRAYLCDFDGTVAPHDIGAELVKRFIVGGRDELAALLDAWRHGKIGSRALTEAEVSWMRVNESDALAFTRTFDLDPHFPAFVREATARGDRVLVVSEGFGLYVGDQLRRAGLADVEWTANRLRFEGDRVEVEFPLAAAGCGRCGNCKAVHVKRERSAGYETVMVGDGLSDRCGAREAARVMARGDLLAWCASQDIAAEAFDDFADVAAAARRLNGARA